MKARRKPRGKPPGRLEQFLDTLVAMRVGQDAGQILAETLEQLRGILNAQAALLFYYDAQEEQLYRSCAEPGKAGADLYDLQITELPPAENARWIDFSNAAHLERGARQHPLAAHLGTSRLLSVGSTAHGNCARLLVAHPRQDPGPHGDPLLRRLTDLLFGLVERVFVLRRVRSRAIDEERNRIAQDFHDGPLQTFFSFDVHLQFIRQILERDPERAGQELEKLQQLARDQGRELRELIQEMRFVDLEGATLPGVLRQVVESSLKSGDLAVRLLAPEPPHREVPRKICRLTYQVLREALNNARKHGRAQHVVVTLEEGSDFFQLSIDDDGSGFQFSGRHNLEEMDRRRIGPVSIKQRARQMGADLTVESTPGRGARLTLRVPVPPAPPK